MPLTQPMGEVPPTSPFEDVQADIDELTRRIEALDNE